MAEPLDENVSLDAVLSGLGGGNAAKIELTSNESSDPVAEESVSLDALIATLTSENEAASDGADVSSEVKTKAEDNLEDSFTLDDETDENPSEAISYEVESPSLEKDPKEEVVADEKPDEPVRLYEQEAAKLDAKDIPEVIIEEKSKPNETNQVTKDPIPVQPPRQAAYPPPYYPPYPGMPTNVMDIVHVPQQCQMPVQAEAPETDTKITVAIILLAAAVCVLAICVILLGCAYAGIL